MPRNTLYLTTEAEAILATVPNKSEFASTAITKYAASHLPAYLSEIERIEALRTELANISSKRRAKRL